MAGKEILFAAYRDEKIDEGLSYAIYLAGQLNAGIRLVLLERHGHGEKLHNIMAAIESAASNEPATAHHALSGKDIDDTASLYSYLMDRCEEEGVKVNIHTAYSDDVGSIEDFLKFRKTDMVVLSPEVSKSGILKGLAKISPTPVVTMNR